MAVLREPFTSSRRSETLEGQGCIGLQTSTKRWERCVSRWDPSGGHLWPCCLGGQAALRMPPAPLGYTTEAASTALYLAAAVTLGKAGLRGGGCRAALRAACCPPSLCSLLGRAGAAPRRPHPLQALDYLVRPGGS